MKKTKIADTIISEDDIFSNNGVAILGQDIKHYIAESILISAIDFLKEGHPQSTPRLRAIIKKSVHKYLDNFIVGKLIDSNNHNYLSYNNQKFILLSYLDSYYRKFGESFFVEYELNKINREDILFLHTLLSFKQLGYIEINDLDEIYITINGVKYIDNGYKCKINLTKTGISLLNNFKKEIDETVPLKPVEVRIDDNLNNNIIWKKTKKKQIQLPNFPNNIKWGDITLRFLNGDEVQITVKESVFHSNYELMGFRDEKTKNPNKQWDLLKLLSRKEGFLNWGNNNELDIKTRNRVKSQKKELSEKLNTYFHTIKDEDGPFFNYREEGGYKIKIQLVPEQDLEDQ